MESIFIMGLHTKVKKNLKLIVSIPQFTVAINLIIFS